MSKVKTNSIVQVERVEPGKLKFTVLGAGEFLFDTSECAAALRAQAEDHGWKQRISDRAAIPHNTTTGKAATPEEKYLAMRELAEHYQTGSEQWSMRGERAGRGPSAETALLIEALVQLYPARTAEQIGKWLSKQSKNEIAGLLVNERIKSLVDELRSAQSAGVDVDGLLMEMETAPD